MAKKRSQDDGTGNKDVKYLTTLATLHETLAALESAIKCARKASAEIRHATWLVSREKHEDFIALANTLTNEKEKSTIISKYDEIKHEVGRELWGLEFSIYLHSMAVLGSRLNERINDIYFEDMIEYGIYNPFGPSFSLGEEAADRGKLAPDVEASYEDKRIVAKKINEKLRELKLAISNPGDGDPCIVLVVQSRDGLGRYTLESRITKKRSGFYKTIMEMQPIKLANQDEKVSPREKT